MDKNSTLSRDVLKLDCSQETEKIVIALRHFLSVRLKRRGAVRSPEVLTAAYVRRCA